MVFHKFLTARGMLVFLSYGYLLVNLVIGYPRGAPSSSCSSMIPGHPGGSIQGSYPPYEVLAAPGQGRVRLILGSPQGLAYKGFLIHARDVETGEYVGQFANIPETAKPVECTPGIENAVTHSNAQEKHNLEFDWEAPVDYEGTIIFNSTVVQDYSTYWVGVESPRISVLKRSIDVMTVAGGPSSTTPRLTTAPYYEPPISDENEAMNGIDDSFYEGCGETKNCFGSSDSCIADKSCVAAVSTFVRGEQYIFEMIARKSKYVAVGLSDDSKMGDDSVVECVNEGPSVRLYMSWNDGKTNARHPTPDEAVTLLESSVKDDVIKCKFSRKKETQIRGRTYNLAKDPYNLLVAAGTGLKAQGIGYHDVIRSASGQPKFLADVGEFKSSSDLLIRLHGALMLASWIGTASIGMVLARYYKQTWVNSHLCGKDQWFAWHRFFMVLTWSMTIAGFVLIFVELGEWSSETIHAALGLATTILCFIQPFMAALRPHPGTPKRALFNWAHWFVGNAAHICAIIAFFFAVRLTKAKLPEWVDWILVAYVVFYILTHLILTFAGCASDSKNDSQRINAFPMKDMHARGAMGHADARRDAPHSSFRQCIFGIYFFIIAAFAVALIVITVLAPIETTWTSFTESISNY